MSEKFATFGKNPDPQIFPHMPSLKSLLKKLIHTKTLLPVIDSQITRNLAEQRRWLLESEMLTDTRPGVTDEKLLGSGDLIVSLTSYGRRLYDVAYTIQSIMRQTQKPNRIILWIDRQDCDRIPSSLKRLQQRGLEIIPTEANIRSYKKLVHALERFPDDTIITIDDDVFYEYDLIERLLGCHLDHPHDICAMRVHRITRERNGTIRPYNKWQMTIKECGCHDDNFLTGVGGVLYPPHSLAEETTDADLFMKLSHTADDVWFTFMARRKGTKIRKVASRDPQGVDFLENYAYREEGLQKINTQGKCLNDKSIAAVATHFSIQP